MQTSLIVAIVAAGAVILIALGLATSGGGSGVSARLERYASGKPDPKAAAGAGGLSEMINQSVAIANLNRVVEQRDFGANLARDIARADLHLKISEYFMIWVGTTLGVPAVMFAASLVLPALGNPFALLIGGLIGFMIPRTWLGRRKSCLLYTSDAA